MISHEKVMCSAILVHDHSIKCIHKPTNIEKGLVITGYRHCDCFEVISRIYPRDVFIKHGHTQGFLTNKNRFVDRVEAKLIATQTNQLLERASNGNELFSEDVW